MELKRLLRNQLDRTVAIGLAIAGLIALYLGFRGVADALLPAQQLPYIASGGLLGLFLLGVGATVWLSADLRDEWRKLDDLVEAVYASGTDTTDTDDRAQRPNAPVTSNGAVNDPDGARRRRSAPISVHHDDAAGN